MSSKNKKKSKSKPLKNKPKPKKKKGKKAGSKKKAIKKKVAKKKRNKKPTMVVTKETGVTVSYDDLITDDFNEGKLNSEDGFDDVGHIPL